MRTIDTYGSFEDALGGAPPAVRVLADRLRALIASVYPAAVEVAWPKQGVVGYGVGAKKATEHFCYLGVHGRHVNLGFNHGAALPDPEGLLEGTGKAFRHVKLRAPDEVDRPGLRRLLEAAVREREAARAPQR